MSDGDTEVEELSTSTCWALLRRVEVGRMALHGVGDEIEMFPVNFIVDQGSIVFKTGAGTKLSLVHQEGRAAFEADGFDFYDGTAWSVVLRGVPNVIQHHDDLIAAFDLQIRPWQVGRKPTFVRLSPDVVTGRRFRVDPTHKDVHR
jgi:nitroimidazol reductase NimA-like FMN-containing flavoprotein (pyridoxamine 5'-phosphate oxidase superfamily)